jgi:type III restriction enzyme
MKLQFDSNQTFQLDAVAAITDLFDGQPQGAPEYAVINVGVWGGLFAGQERTDLGAGNRLLLAADKLLANTRAIQTRNDMEVTDPAAPLEAWELFDGPANQARLCPHFSVEMETGTGKTYVYLRTIFELSRRYSFQKFIIVVPSVAIREGVLKNIEITAEHFRALYNNLPFEHFVYDARKVNRLRQFATSNTLQVLVINIDAFRKNFIGTEAEQKSNVIYKESDKLSGRQPIEFVQAARPIVIIDEPQSVDATDRAQEGIKALNPLCTLRYSATHRHPYNLVYRLDPVRAFELKLVKQIVVASAVAEDAAHDAFVRVEQIDNKKGIKARLRIHMQTAGGPKERAVTVKHRADLFVLSNERPHYAQGFAGCTSRSTSTSSTTRRSNVPSLASSTRGKTSSSLSSCRGGSRSTPRWAPTTRTGPSSSTMARLCTWSARPRGRGISCSCAPARPTKFAAVSSTSQPSACRLPLRSAPTRCDCPRADRTKTRHFYAGTSAAHPGAHRGEGWRGAPWPGHVPQDGIG